jgi:integrase-like protein
VVALEAAAAELARLGIRMQRVPTDNGSPYRAHVFDAAVAGLGARHKRTRPFRPQTNGKPERLIQTLLREWAYSRAYASTQERAAALPDFVETYNRQRPHTALRGRSPLDAVNDLVIDHFRLTSVRLDDRGLRRGVHVEAEHIGPVVMADRIEEPPRGLNSSQVEIGD